MEKNTTTFETGATSSAVNELILYTDNTRELAEKRDNYYFLVLHAGDSLEMRMIDLFFDALQCYKREFPYTGKYNQIRDMTQIERNEYKRIYANRFEEWKKEKERQELQANKRDRFTTPYQQYKEHNGKEFEILREHTDKTDEEDRGKLYDIKLETGEEITAWPEEIFNNVSK